MGTLNFVHLLDKNLDTSYTTDFGEEIGGGEEKK